MWLGYKIIAWALLVYMHQTVTKHTGKNKRMNDTQIKRKQLKAAGSLGISTRLGFKPMELPKNATVVLKAKEDEKKRAEYIRLRLSPKHAHKLRRKTKIASTSNTNEKRSNLMERGQLDFHLAADDQFIDQRAAKRVGIVSKGTMVLY